METNIKSVSKNVHEAIIKTGLDYLIGCAKKGESVENKIHEAIGRAYDGRFEWYNNYQIDVMNAMKVGGLF